jgi:predicted metal-dependent hydrolase
MINTLQGASSRVRVRKMGFQHAVAVERFWFAGDEVRTALFNGMGVLFPRLEEFLIRVAKDGQSVLNERASTELRAFIGQEAQHLAQHRRQAETLRVDSDRLARLLDALDRVVGLIDKLDFRTRVAVAAAGEHFTASLSEHFLRRGLPGGIPPEARALYEWHFAEEIEHKSVLFDVMQHSSVSYLRRVMGLAIALVLVPGSFTAAMFAFLVWNGSLGRWSVWRETLRVLLTVEALVPLVMRAAWQFLRPSFHPAQIDNDELVAATLAATHVRSYVRT